MKLLGALMTPVSVFGSPGVLIIKLPPQLLTGTYLLVPRVVVHVWWKIRTAEPGGRLGIKVYHGREHQGLSFCPTVGSPVLPT